MLKKPTAENNIFRLSFRVSSPMSERGIMKSMKQLEEKIVDTPLSRLSAYYLECLAKDRDDDLSCWASNKFGSPDYGQLSVLPKVNVSSDDIYAS